MMVAILYASEAGEEGLVERVAERVHGLTGVDKKGRKKVSYDSILKRAREGVTRFRTQWLPFLQETGVIEASEGKNASS